MQTAALKSAPPPSIGRAEAGTCILVVTGRRDVAIRPGTIVTFGDIFSAFYEMTPVKCPELEPGRDYFVRIDDAGNPAAFPAEGLPVDDIFAGFHFAPGGNATARAGGDAEPAINPFSVWDIGFRPACPDPRGMALVDGRFWADIYLLGVDHLAEGTSRCGATIADGRDRPARLDGKGTYEALDYPTAVEVYAHHGKQLMTYDEFRIAALGVTERTAADRDPKTAGLDAARTSRWGLMQATGNLWIWGTDGDPDNPRASFFGGHWYSGVFAGSRCARLGDWPGYSYGIFSARGRCDHLMPA